MPYEKNDDELGALWIKDKGRGPYMTGRINGESVVVFRNDKKTSDKQPDWRVLRAKTRDQRNDQANANVTANDYDQDPPF